MAKAAAVKKKGSSSAKTSAAAKKRAPKVKVPTRKVSLERRGAGGKVSKVSVVVQKRLEVPAPPKPAPPPARPIKLEGSPLEVSRRFYETHQLQPLAAALPPVAMLDELVPRATTEGFNRVLLFPALKVQRAHAEAMVWQLLRAPSAALDPTEQYGMPWLYDLQELLKGEVRNRPEGAYALALSDAPFPDDTRDRKSSQLETRFQALGQCSLTVFEYMVVQRLLAEERQDHRFDQAVDAHGFPSGWQWLLDSKSARGSLHASWSAVKRRIEIGTTPASNFNSKRGAHPTLLKAL
ncbi:MAG: hypothetical protein IPJ65_02380 [Archangiaceae bacterium]|nr:hypothetical protein [Archangiaceae bacterium]